MKVVKYELVYSDGRNYREYASPMTMDKAKLKIAELVARHFAGSPAIDYTDWGSGEIEALARYPQDIIGSHIAWLRETED